MNREELIALANEIEYCIKNHVQPFLTEKGWANVAAALRSQADSASTTAQVDDLQRIRSALETLSDPLLVEIDDGLVGITRALAIINRMSEIAKTAILHIPSPERTSDGVKLALEKMLVAWDSLPPGHHKPKAVDKWLHSPLWKEAVTTARAALSSTPTDALPIVTRTHDVS